MKLKFLYTELILFCQTFCLAQGAFTPYFGQTPPGNMPEIFAQSLISLSGREEKIITFSPDGKEAFFVIDPYPNCRILYAKFIDDHWTTPAVVSFSINRLCDEPFFSLDGNRVYYWTTINGEADLCYSEKNDSTWGPVTSLGSPINISSGQYHPCIVADTSIYFVNSGGDICRSQYKNGNYQQRVALSIPINGIAESGSNYKDPYVDQNEQYMIFQSRRAGGFGGSDIYISYKKGDGTWTNPKNLGSNINASGDETDADITPDGLYMTFSKNGDIYWVRSSFIDSLRHTNFIPYKKSQISAQKDTIGVPFSFTLPDSIFIDDDGNSTLAYSATSSTGAALPSWMQFDSLMRTFSGIPTGSGTFGVKVTAADTANASASCTFNFIIANSSGVTGADGIPAVLELQQNYPNPFNPSTTLSFSIPSRTFVSLKIFDMLGREVATIVSEEMPVGNYSKQWNASNLSSGVYFYRLQAGTFTDAKKLILLK